MKIIKYVLPLSVLNLITLILVTFGLPEVVPLHIGLTGTVDLMGSRWFVPIIGLIPILVVIIYDAYIPLTKSELNMVIGDKMISGVTLALIAISWIPVFLALAFTNLTTYPSSLSIEIISFVGIIIAILFVFIGYYLENLKHNWILGIRTPWTLKNETVWKKTHKLGSYTSMISGFVLLVYSIATYLSGNIDYFFIGLVIALILIAVIPITYSYYEYKKLN